MKKVAIILVSLLYFTGLVLITFLGIRIEISPSKIVTEVESIVLDEVKGDEDGRFYYYYDGVEHESSLVYSVYTRPSEDQINKYEGTDKDGNLWNLGEEKFQYIATMYNFTYIYDTNNWIGNTKAGTYQINASVLPTNSSIQLLSYNTTNTTDISLSKDGLITFNKFENRTRFTVKISANDNSKTEANVRFICEKYI